MHPWQINCIVANAFDGFGDTGGDDDFGMSFAWVDLDDHLENYGTNDDVPEGALSELLIEYTGSRWVLAFINSDGVRWVNACSSEEEMKTQYRALAEQYGEYLDGVETS